MLKSVYLTVQISTVYLTWKCTAYQTIFILKCSQIAHDWCDGLNVVFSRVVVEGAVSSNAKQVESSVPLITAERSDFYPWSSDNLVFKRGPALIFSQQAHSLLAKNFEKALENLEYCPRLINLSETEVTLQNREPQPFFYWSFSFSVIKYY
jgi:hypothetical protein